MGEVLVLRALKLGDLLVAVPALKALRRAYPEHRIRYAAQGWLAPVLDLVGGIHLLDVHGLDVPLPVAHGSIDVAVNLHGRGPISRERLDAVEPQARMGHRYDGPGPVWEGPDWVDDIHERARWARLVNWYGLEADPDDVALAIPDAPSPRPGATVIHAGAAHGSRLWPVDRFADVARTLTVRGHDVVLTGSAGERDRALAIAEDAGLAEASVLAGELPLDRFAALVAGARAVVSADTGAAHLASAYGRPSVVLFGPASPEHWGPPPGPHVVLTDESVRRGDAFADDPDPALLAVTARAVVAALDGLTV